MKITKFFKYLKGSIKTQRKLYYKNKYYDKINVICDSADDVDSLSISKTAKILDSLFFNLGYKVIYWGSNEMYVDTPYAYLKIKLVINNYMCTSRVITDDTLDLSAYYVEEIVLNNLPKRAFKKLFNKREVVKK